MGFGLKLFGSGKSVETDVHSSRELNDARSVGMERALRFAKQPRPKYSHTKKDALKTALMSLERAVLSIDSTQIMLEETRSLLETALEAPDEIDESKRSLLTAQVIMMQDRLQSYIEAATIDGLNLVDGHGSHLTIALSESTTGQLVIRRVNLTPHGMGLSELDQTFETTQSVKDALTLVNRAFDYVSTQNETFCANATILAEHYDRL